MARIIIEDMKINKRREPTILKKKIVSSVDTSSSRNFYKEETIKEKEVEKIKEKEIDEYYKNKNIK